MASRILILALAATAAACTPEREQEPPAPAAPQADTPAPVAPVAPAEVPREPAGSNVLTLAGLGGIVIGRPPPASGAAALTADAVQISPDCRTWRSPRLPGVYVMTDGKVVTRITLMRDSPVATERGIRLGASEAEIRRAYPQLEETPHEYADAPAKNLVWRPAASASGLRFEIDGSGRANLIHAGVPPWLNYSEGCA